MKETMKLLMVVLGLVLLAGAVSAAGNAAFVTLVEKTPVPDGPYPIVDGGASGKMMYKSAPKPMFEFNGQGLVAGEKYALISYAETWGDPAKVQGTGVANAGGNVHIAGGALDLVCNGYPTGTSNEYSGTGSKIWLVPFDDLTTVNGVTTLTAWNPEEYLFETALINTGCTVPT
jgi:hypothetical protein